MILNAIITAGGKGKRLSDKIKKQYIELEGKPILFHTLEKFSLIDSLAKIIVTAPKEDVDDLQNRINSKYNEENIIVVEGGVERQNSVYNGILSCDKNCEIVLIHDGVRPFITINEINLLINSAKENNAVIPVAPVKHTIKKISNNIVDNTISRENLYEVYTPQVFSYRLIKEIHEKAIKDNFIGTDDASLCERYKIPVFSILGSTRNIKITEPFDLKIAKAILEEENEMG